MLRGHNAIPIALQHRQGTIDQVAQAVGEFGSVARLETGVSPVSVRADIQLAQDIKPERIHAPFIDHSNRIHHVTGAFAHAFAIFLPPAVHENLFWQRKAHRFEHDRPINRVELQNILADDMKVAGPQGKVRSARCRVRSVQGRRNRFIAVRGRNADVIHQCVKPHVRDVIRIEGQGDAPVQP